MNPTKDLLTIKKGDSHSDFKLIFVKCKYDVFLIYVELWKKSLKIPKGCSEYVKDKQHNRQTKKDKQWSTKHHT